MDSDSSYDDSFSDKSMPPLIRSYVDLNPFDISNSSSNDTISLSASGSSKSASSTYGELVNEIHSNGSRILRYHEDYLKTRSIAPAEENPQYEFVSKGDYLCAGRDFAVYAGFLFRDYSAAPSFPCQRVQEHSYGDSKFVKPWSGTSASASSSWRINQKPTRVSVALKESTRSIHQFGNRPLVLGTFMKEVRVMGKLKSCVNVVDLLGVAFVEVGQEVKPTLVVELALGNLIEFFHSQISSTITWELKLSFASHIAAALQALHEKNIVHADVKGQNVLVFQDKGARFCAKLSDFGNSTEVDSELPTAPGTKYYLAPECFGSEIGETVLEPYGNSVYRDIYALGLLIWEMTINCRHLPFCEVSSDEEVREKKRSLNGDAARYLLGQVPEDTPLFVSDVITHALDAEPTRRPSIDAVRGQLQQGAEQISSKHSPLSDTLAQFTSPASNAIVNEDHLLKIPWSLQKQLREESMTSSVRNLKAKVYLAYCYILCSDNHQDLRFDALHLLRQAACTNPFYLASEATLTPFRAMMELQDWEGLDMVLQALDDDISDRATQSLHQILSFGWRRFLSLACAAGAPQGPEDRGSDSLRISSENIVVASVKLLADAGYTDVGRTSCDGVTALHLASASGKPHAVASLLAHGADSSALEKDHRTPLHLCCQATTLSDSASTEIARLIVEWRSAAVNDVMKDTLYTPLRFSVEAEKPQLCQLLLENGADVNACAAEGSTALLECAWVSGRKGNGRKDGEGSKDEGKALMLAKILLQHGQVEIDLQTCHNSVTALGIAAVHGNFTDMVSLLLDHGANPNTSVDSLTALAGAVHHNNATMVSVLLNHGADPNFAVRNATPLGEAVALDLHEMTAVLLQHGANPNTPANGIPLVCWAIYGSKHSDELCPNVSLLLAQGASSTATAQTENTPNSRICGWSAVHFAAYTHSMASLSVVLAHEGSIFALTDDDETVLHIAVSNRGPNDDSISPILQYIIDHGIDLDATNCFGETALHLASKFHLDSVRQFLIESGCNSDAQDSSGITPQQLYSLDSEALSHRERARRKTRAQQQNKQSLPTPPSVGTEEPESSGNKVPEDQHDQGNAGEGERQLYLCPSSEASGRSRRLTLLSASWNNTLLTCLACTLIVVGVAFYMRRP